MLIFRQYYRRTSDSGASREFFFQRFTPHGNAFSRLGQDGPSSNGAWVIEDIRGVIMNGYTLLPFILEIEYTTP